MIFEYWHPTIISYSDNPFHKDIEKKLIEYCFQLEKEKERGGHNWISKGVYNTHHTHNIINDINFKKINDWVMEESNKYCKKIESIDTVKLQNGWFNIYEKKDFQEFHTHPGSTLSAIYILKCDEVNGARTIFETYSPENFLDLKCPTNDRLIHYKSKPGRLLLFKSTLRHCVEQHQIDDSRITIAYNLIKNS
jgi:uncharacterized protein (TIGR02466 family)